MPPLPRRSRLLRIAQEPTVNVVVIELLGPEQTCKSLPLHESLVQAESGGMDRGIEGIGLRNATGECSVEIRERIFDRTWAEPDLYCQVGAGRYICVHVAGQLAAMPLVHAGVQTLHNGVIDSVLYIGRGVGHSVQPFMVGVIFREQ